MRIVFATQNQNKLREVQALLGDNFQLVDLTQLNFHDDIPENQPTIRGNASEKAWFIYNKFGISCFADDTGLEIDALNGAPGVYSARYAGPGRDAHDNLLKVLSEMKDSKNRDARFKTILSLILDGKEFFFEGIVQGKILEREKGIDGFGYDPIFVPNGYEQTFAEMPLALKNEISHRGIAFKALNNYLKQNSIR
ncbi:RdgB/HAM1 family non-canonical purine NTP pyrophosphatase [Williamwhitmania taraxaci]|uniref:dITP/XTP pyrophosphatase n=1 Tax=Williamwhitmania taraxaci TaxID=1640674 RepID=A0A1G6P054_9BACT|nr:RdgB/HAM1 family non-canonical purine NTP pyrophosphatase [Williamwhitmania taraxaci]SDC73429.1 XTP/dITP diphosphohydrolase [Williamwhitmania taraxaci]